jgi:hypothetical protein
VFCRPRPLPEERQESRWNVGGTFLIFIKLLTLFFRPPWKMFAFTFWGSKPYDQKYHSDIDSWSFNPLGPEWNLVSVLLLVLFICRSLKLSLGHIKYVFL